MVRKSKRELERALEKLGETDTGSPLRVQIGGDPDSVEFDPDLDITVDMYPPRGDSA